MFVLPPPLLLLLLVAGSSLRGVVGSRMSRSSSVESGESASLAPTLSPLFRVNFEFLRDEDDVS